MLYPTMHFPMPVDIDDRCMVTVPELTRWLSWYRFVNWSVTEHGSAKIVRPNKPRRCYEVQLWQRATM